MGKDVIIACDFADRKQTLDFLEKFSGKKPFVKIGMELYYAEGPAIVKEIKKRGHKIFLDLKFTIFLIQSKSQCLYYQDLMLI